MPAPGKPRESAVHFEVSEKPSSAPSDTGTAMNKTGSVDHVGAKKNRATKKGRLTNFVHDHFGTKESYVPTEKLHEEKEHNQRPGKPSQLHLPEPVMQVAEKMPHKQTKEERLAEAVGKRGFGDPLQAYPRLDSKGKQQDDDVPHTGTALQDMLTTYAAANRDLDAEDYKMDFAVEDLLEDVTENWHKRLRKVAQVVIADKRFEAVFAVMVVLNVLVTALETDLKETMPEIFTTANLFFCLVFVVELAVRIAAHPSRAAEPLMLFDTFIVAIALIEFIIDAQGPNSAVSLQNLLALRLFRMIRVVRLMRFLNQLESLEMLFEAVSLSMQPLVFVIVLFSLLFMAFGMVMTSMVPLVAYDSERIFNLVTSNYGHLSHSVMTLLQATCGVDEWGVTVAFVLYEDGITQGKFWSLVFLLLVLLAICTLYFGITGLVTGIFLDEMFTAAAHIEQTDINNNTAQGSALLHLLDSVFTGMGYRGDEELLWPAFAASLEKNLDERCDEIGLTLEVAERIYKLLAQESDEAVTVDRFIWAIFKFRTISKSIDMISLDWQHEKVLRRIMAVGGYLRDNFAQIQNRLSRILFICPRLEKRLLKVEEGLKELRELEELLNARRKAMVQGYRPPEVEEEETERILKLEEIAIDYRVNAKLECLERKVDLLTHRYGSEDGDLEFVASAIVEGVKAKLDREMASLREAQAGLRSVDEDVAALDEHAHLNDGEESMPPLRDGQPSIEKQSTTILDILQERPDW